MTSPVETKWTPGPWFVEGLIVTTFGGANQLARFLFGKFKGPEEAAANARVSAAAPELYEALNRCEPHIEAAVIFFAERFPDQDADIFEVLRLLRAALAKAVTP